MEKDFLQKSLYEALHNNVLLPCAIDIDREDEREAQVLEIINKLKDLPICKERFFALTVMFGGKKE